MPEYTRADSLIDGVVDILIDSLSAHREPADVRILMEAFLEGFSDMEPNMRAVDSSLEAYQVLNDALNGDADEERLIHVAKSTFTGGEGDGPTPLPMMAEYNLNRGGVGCVMTVLLRLGALGIRVTPDDR